MNVRLQFNRDSEPDPPRIIVATKMNKPPQQTKIKKCSHDYHVWIHSHHFVEDGVSSHIYD